MDDSDQQKQARILEASEVKPPYHHIRSDRSGESTSEMDDHQNQERNQPQGKIFPLKRKSLSIIGLNDHLVVLKT